VSPGAAEAEEGRALSDDERARLLAALRSEDRLLGQLLDGVGLRSSEALALEWDDIDVGQRVVHVRRRIYRGHVGPPKSKRSRREIPLSRDLALALFEARANATGSLVLPSRQTGRHRSYAAVAAAVQQGGDAGRRGGRDDARPPPHVRVKALRDRLDVLTLSRLLGHSDVTVTLRVYVHEMPCAPVPDIDALLGGEGHKRDTAPDATGYARVAETPETAIS